MNFKQEAAKRAVTLIENNMTIGLGAGATIAFLVDYIQEEIKVGKEISLVTSSFSTLQLLLANKLAVVNIGLISETDIYFDSCDQLDYQLNALKSGGGIHTHEKLCASIAKEFILIGDETKLVSSFDARFPLVVEVIPEALRFVLTEVKKRFQSVTINFRAGDKKDGPVITSNGNYLLDIWFMQYPELPQINPLLKSIVGIVETSLFYQVAHKAIIAGENGVRILEKVA